MTEKFVRLVSKDLLPVKVTAKEQAHVLLESSLKDFSIYKATERKVNGANNRIVTRYRYAFAFPYHLSVILLNSPISSKSHQYVDTLHYILEDSEQLFVHLISEGIDKLTTSHLKLTISLNLDVGEEILLKDQSLLISAIFLGYHTLSGKNSYVFKVKQLYERHHSLKEDAFYEYVIDSRIFSEYSNYLCDNHFKGEW